MTPEQLREWADAIDGEKPWAPKAADVIDQLRAHADALEELARVKKAISESCDEQRGEYFGCRRAERAEAALAECRAKLEVDPRTKYDGIDSRDETIRLLEQKCERLAVKAHNPARHEYWGAGELGCPEEIKAPNGELHTMRCKQCGIDNPQGDICLAGASPSNHVAWCRYKQGKDGRPTTIHLCNSDDPGAFKVYRAEFKE